MGCQTITLIVLSARALSLSLPLYAAATLVSPFSSLSSLPSTSILYFMHIIHISISPSSPSSSSSSHRAVFTSAFLSSVIFSLCALTSPYTHAYVHTYAHVRLHLSARNISISALSHFRAVFSLSFCFSFSFSLPPLALCLYFSLRSLDFHARILEMIKAVVVSH